MAADGPDFNEASGAGLATSSYISEYFATKSAGRYAIPSTGVDLINDTSFRWTLNASAEARKLAPRITINLLEMQTGQMAQLLAQAKNLVTDPYDGIYKLELAYRMVLPFFSNMHHSNQNTWEELSLESLTSNVANSLGGTVGDLAKAVVGGIDMARSLSMAFVEPASKTESPRVWKDIGLETVNFGFNLYNTSPDVYAKHKAFVDLMVFWSLPDKKKMTFALPPVLCEYSIPGIRRGLMATFNFTVNTKGQSVYNGENVPDAYELQFSLGDILMQTRNINPTTGPRGLGGKIENSSGTNVYQGSASAKEKAAQAEAEARGTINNTAAQQAAGREEQ